MSPCQNFASPQWIKACQWKDDQRKAIRISTGFGVEQFRLLGQRLEFITSDILIPTGFWKFDIESHIERLALVIAMLGTCGSERRTWKTSRACPSGSSVIPDCFSLLVDMQVDANSRKLFYQISSAIISLLFLAGQFLELPYGSFFLDLFFFGWVKVG